MLTKLQETSGYQVTLSVNNQMTARMAAREVATNCGIAMGMPLTTNYRQDELYWLIWGTSLDTCQFTYMGILGIGYVMLKGRVSPTMSKPTRSLSEFQVLFVSASVVFKCMGDPNVDHGFYYDDQGRVDVLHSPFFDVAFENDTTADEYVERILYQLTLAIEDQLPASRWCLVSRRPSPPNPATSPATSTRGIPLLLVASLLHFIFAACFTYNNSVLLSVLVFCLQPQCFVYYPASYLLTANGVPRRKGPFGAMAHSVRCDKRHFEHDANYTRIIK
ncbi:hypothetical protein M5K25_012283 [Dendrobium thyrsiflorum]|uniref:Uncharacterized protein n=1 Tax=Dendrobium thyrsiflorum TaxID=117978 RepID=A0ABD0UX68_DENTH